MCIDDTYCWREENESLIRCWIVWDRKWKLEVEINEPLALESFYSVESEGCGGDYMQHRRNWPVLAQHSVIQEVTNVLVFVESWTALERCDC